MRRKFRSKSPIVIKEQTLETLVEFLCEYNTPKEIEAVCFMLVSLTSI